jgi:hypothetical protein
MQVDYTSANSSDTVGLLALEELIKLLGPPKWPWAVDTALAARGAVVFKQSGCFDCHQEKPGAFRGLVPSWATPLQDVGTDNREWTMFSIPGMADWPGWTVDTGVLSGASALPGLVPKLKPTDAAFTTLTTAVTGTIVQRLVNYGDKLDDQARPDAGPRSDLIAPGVHAHSDRAQELKTVFDIPAKPEAPFKYESRVLYGVWAAAPYLHNGSVPTLEDLLKPAAERPKSFKIGPEYDPVKVGLAAEQTATNYTLHTTGCDQRTSGDSNCGHEFGTSLSADDKKALLEYLKTL